MIIWAIIKDGLFAAIAAVGFGAISDPQKRTLGGIALLGAIGHAIRFILMNILEFDIASASFVGAFSIGMISYWLGKKLRCPMTTLYIPALLPMVPGIYAYRSVHALIMFMQSMAHATTCSNQATDYMHQFLFNATVASLVIALLAVGATAPMMIIGEKAFALTRRKNHTTMHKCKNKP